MKTNNWAHTDLPAVKVHECLQKLQGTKGSEVDREVHTRFTIESAQVETAESKSGSPKRDPTPTVQIKCEFKESVVAF